ncbi:hypothetical protein B7494_g4686 [Chlorociboria aeruginascens]|nr:hypothetical protein B7494_g4686 [Chlorociboria aeruginascens]
MYSGSKFALEALSEALYHELTPLGIRVLIVSTGAFRSQFAANLVFPKKPLPLEYTGTITEQVTMAWKDIAKAG